MTRRPLVDTEEAAGNSFSSGGTTQIQEIIRKFDQNSGSKWIKNRDHQPSSIVKEAIEKRRKKLELSSLTRSEVRNTLFIFPVRRHEVFFDSE